MSGDAPTAGRGLRLAVAAVVLAVGTYLVVDHASALREAVGSIGPGAIVTAGLLGLLGTVLIGQVWYAVVRGLGVDAPVVAAGGVFFVSQLGKYLPGSVWPVVAQMEFGRRWGAARRTMLIANVLMLAVITTTGLVVGAVLLPWSSRDGLTRYWWTLLLLVPLVVCLHPRVIPVLLDRVSGWLGREPLGARIGGGAMLAAIGWSLAVWLVMGLHLFVMTSTLDVGTTGAKDLAAAVGGMGLAWAAGLLFVPAPAGAGVREAVLVATFAPQIGAAPALAVALASRVLLLLSDVVLAALGAAVGTGRRAPEPGVER